MAISEAQKWLRTLPLFETRKVATGEGEKELAIVEPMGPNGLSWGRKIGSTESRSNRDGSVTRILDDSKKKTTTFQTKLNPPVSRMT
ncbi:hypothetical protein L1049_013954 [Liquidambar formosana]|uniref:Uncharacterized protein n=1 Tax=Liquidambar formosana TaxID=63359 RepID=A0AAP0RL89_LIQFO